MGHNTNCIQLLWNKRYQWSIVMSIPYNLLMSGTCVIQWRYSYISRRNFTGSPGLFDYLVLSFWEPYPAKTTMTKYFGKCFFNVQHISLYQIYIRTSCIPHNGIEKMTSVDDCRNSAWMRQLRWNPNQGCDLKLSLLFYSWTLHQRGKGHEIDKSILPQVIAGLKNITNPVEHLLLIDNQLVVHSSL